MKKIIFYNTSIIIFFLSTYAGDISPSVSQQEYVALKDTLSHKDITKFPVGSFFNLKEFKQNFLQQNTDIDDVVFQITHQSHTESFRIYKSVEENSNVLLKKSETLHLRFLKIISQKNSNHDRMSFKFAIYNEFNNPKKCDKNIIPARQLKFDSYLSNFFVIISDIDKMSKKNIVSSLGIEKVYEEYKQDHSINIIWDPMTCEARCWYNPNPILDRTLNLFLYTDQYCKDYDAYYTKTVEPAENSSDKKLKNDKNENKKIITPLFYFQHFPLEVIANIIKQAQPQVRKDILSTCRYFTENIHLLKGEGIKKIAQNILRQNIFNKHFEFFANLDESVAKNYPILLRDNLVFKKIYNNNRVLFFLKYALLADLNEKTITQVNLPIKIITGMFEIDGQKYGFNQCVYEENNIIKYQTLWIPFFHVVTTQDFNYLKKIIERFPTLQRIIVGYLARVGQTIKEDFPFKDAHVIIQFSPVRTIKLYNLYHGNTLLHFPELDYEIHELLLKNNADLNVFAGNGNTPLHAAVQKGEVKNIELLLKHTADPYFKNNSNETPADIAIHWLESATWPGERTHALQKIKEIWKKNYPGAIKKQAKLTKIQKSKRFLWYHKDMITYIFKSLMIFSLVSLGGIFSLWKLTKRYPHIKKSIF